MKILHIHPSMQGGGIESMICALANAMAYKADVSVCSIFEPKSDDVFWGKLSPKVHRLTLGKIRAGFSLSEVVKIYSLCKNGGYDVVNIHGYLYYYVLAVIFLRRKIKFFYTIHSDAYKENARWDKLLFRFKRFCFKNKWVRPITISANSKQSFFDMYACESRLIYNGVPAPSISDEDILSKYKITPATKLFIHAGRIDVSKNQLVLCQVFDELIRKGNDVVLLIAGSKQDVQIFKSLEPYFSNRIIYMGERDDVPQLMSQCDAMCLPSIWEGMPVTLLEALSVSCVPIGSPVGGITNGITHMYNGLLSISSSYEDYLSVMKSFLLLTTDEYNKIKEECVRSFNPFNITVTANNYLNYYNE